MFFIRVAAVTSKLAMRYALDHAITPLMNVFRAARYSSLACSCQLHPALLYI